MINPRRRKVVYLNRKVPANCWLTVIVSKRQMHFAHRCVGNYMLIRYDCWYEEMRLFTYKVEEEPASGSGRSIGILRLDSDGRMGKLF